MTLADTGHETEWLADTRSWLDQQSMVLACPYIYPPVSRYEPISGSSLFSSELFARPIALYFHIPYCSYKCEFCNFALDVLSEANAPVNTYLEKLADELTFATRPTDAPISATSIHVGGGTPTVLNSRQIDLFFDMLDERVSRSQLKELCFEATPDSIGKSPKKITQLADHGVNRFSIGVQSFQQSELVKMKRMHSEVEVFRAYDTVRTREGLRINVDLMFGFPDQSLASFEQDIRTAAKLGVDAITLYELRIPPRSIDLTVKADARLTGTDYVVFAQSLLADLGYLRSSPSQYVRSPAAYQQHYIDVREDLRPLAGFGVSALGFSSGISYKGAPTLRDYMTSPSFEEHYRGCALTVQDQINRAAVLGIRSPRGLNCDVFKDTFGAEFSEVFSTLLDDLEKRGLAEIVDRRFRLTDMGALFVDQIAVLFYGHLDKEIVKAHDKEHLGVYWH